MVYLHCFGILFMGIWGMLIVVIVHVLKKTLESSQCPPWDTFSSVCNLFPVNWRQVTKHMHCFPIKDNLIISIFFPFSAYPFNWAVGFFFFFNVFSFKAKSLKYYCWPTVMNTWNTELGSFISGVLFMCNGGQAWAWSLSTCNKGYGGSFCRASIHF